MLTDKDYCDYETCVALKELGFDDVTHYNFNKDGVRTPRIPLYEAQKFLREEHNIHIDVRLHGIFGYQYEVWTSEGAIAVRREFLTYEEALSEGIKEAIKILKEK